MVDRYENLLTEDEIQLLLEYFEKDDDRTDAREFVRSKHPIWGKTDWPESIIKRLLDTVLDYEYEVEEVVINQSKISFQIHTDNGYSNPKASKAVLIPLFLEDGIGSTVYFDNYYNGDASKFVREKDVYENHQRPEKSLTPKDNRISDYTLIENFNDIPFDSDLHQKYLNHIPIENLHGLTIDKVAKWKVGDAIVFDRNQLHAASSEHSLKIGISVFTNKK